MRFFQDSRGVSVAGVTGPRMPAKFLYHNVVSAGSAQAAIPSFFFLFFSIYDYCGLTQHSRFGRIP